MFGKDTLKTIVGQDVAISSDMVNKIDEWDCMLKGKAKWCNEDVHSLRLEQSICQEFSNIVVSEMETKVDNDKLDELYQTAIGTLNENLQNGLALGSFVVKPLGGNDVEYITADHIVPINYDAKGRLTSCAFIQSKTISDTVTMYRIEFHLLMSDGLTISNKAYKGTSSDIGKQVDLASVDEWKDLPEEITYPDMKRVDFGFYRNPIPNIIDGSFNGISIYEKAIDAIRDADEQKARLNWEFQSGERMVFADYTTLMKTNKNSKGETVTEWINPKLSKRLMAGIDKDGALDTFNPEIRDVNYINGLNEYLRRVEFSCSLAYGDLSKAQSIEKTATEIKTSQKRKYDMVNAIQKNLKDCLTDLVYALAFYNQMYNSGFNFSCDFKDSILTDEETERGQDRLDMASGVMSQLEYRMKWYGEDEATARSKLPAVDDKGVIN